MSIVSHTNIVTSHVSITSLVMDDVTKCTWGMEGLQAWSTVGASELAEQTLLGVRPWDPRRCTHCPDTDQLMHFPPQNTAVM